MLTFLWRWAVWPPAATTYRPYCRSSTTIDSCSADCLISLLSNTAPASRCAVQTYGRKRKSATKSISRLKSARQAGYWLAPPNTFRKYSPQVWKTGRRRVLVLVALLSARITRSRFDVTAWRFWERKVWSIYSEYLGETFFSTPSYDVGGFRKFFVQIDFLAP